MYEGFFGLSDAPFRLTPDPHFLYLSPKHAEALAHLRLGLTEPGGFVCITGEIGAGKTTVLRAFLADLGPDVCTAFVFNPTLSWSDLLQRIARELGVPGAESAASDVDRMDALNAHLLAERKQGRTSVLVIDEAQTMPRDVLERLRLLSNLETSTEKLLRLVLVGQPELARLLLDPALAQLNQRITLRWHLEPLTRAETAAYVRHRLAVAGGEAAMDLFTPPALWAVHFYAGGVPRLVNMIAHRATLVAYVLRQRHVGVAAVRRAYREIGRVPLAASRRMRRLGWAASALAAGLALAMIGVPRPASEAPAAKDAEPAPLLPSRPPVPAAPPVRTDLERRLAAAEAAQDLRAALDAVFAAWGERRLGPDERPTPASLARAAEDRGLETLRLTSNLSMLRLLDLPAVLELRSPDTGERSHAALTAVDDDAVTLRLGGDALRVPAAALDRVWFGDAYVLWRDFEAFGPTFGAGAHGAKVERLQMLLARAGAYGGPVTGRFDAATEAAVRSFQRSRLLEPDCRVGQLTRIALYGAAGRHRVPTLARGGAGRAVAAGRAAGGAT